MDLDFFMLRQENHFVGRLLRLITSLSFSLVLVLYIKQIAQIKDI